MCKWLQSCNYPQERPNEGERFLSSELVRTRRVARVLAFDRVRPAGSAWAFSALEGITSFLCGRPVSDAIEPVCHFSSLLIAPVKTGVDMMKQSDERRGRSVFRKRTLALVKRERERGRHMDNPLPLWYA